MIVGLIPARSGSKGVPNKNIKLLGGHPLMAWSIVASLNSRMIDKTIVSTDSAEYALIATDYGAEILMRPPELATDDADDWAYIKHAFDETKADYIVVLRPTTPLRDVEIIDHAIEYYKSFNHFDFDLRSMHCDSEPVFKHMKLSGLYAISLCTVNPNMPRREYEQTYHPNGYIDICKRDRINPVYYPYTIRHFLTMFAPEIDTEDDFDYIEWRLNKYGSPLIEHLRNIRCPE